MWVLVKLPAWFAVEDLPHPDVPYELLVSTCIIFTPVPTHSGGSVGSGRAYTSLFGMYPEIAVFLDRGTAFLLK